MSVCVTVAHFCEQCTEIIMQHHADFVPLLGKATEDNDDVAARALYALQFFAEELRTTFANYSDPFMRSVLNVAKNGSLHSKESALGAIGSIAVAIGPQFQKYLGPAVSVLQHYMSVRDDDFLELRARATEACGSVALAVGRNVIGDPALQAFTRCAFEGIRIESDRHEHELRASTYAFFGCMADVLGPDFVPILNELYPFIETSLVSGDGMMMNGKNSDSSGLEQLVNQGDEEGDDDDDGEDFEEGDQVTFSFRTPFIEEKKSVIGLVRVLSEKLGKALGLYIEKFLPLLLPLVTYQHGEVRNEAVKALPSVLHIVNDLFGQGKWERGKFQAQKPLAKQVGVMTDVMMKVMTFFGLKAGCFSFFSFLSSQELIQVLKDERDADVVTTAVESIERCIKEVGPVCMELFIKDLVENLRMIFEKKSFCQALREHFDEDERDLELFNVAVDCVVTMCHAAGPTPFGGELLKVFFPHMRQMAQQNQPETYRALAAGALAEFCVNLEASSQPFAADIVKLAMFTAQSEDVVTARNSIYCLGAAVQFGGPSVAAAVPPVLQRIKKMLESEDLPGRDNAVGALARIVLSGNDKLPVPDMVSAMMSGLPLKGDLEPYAPLFHCMVKLLRSPVSNLVIPHLQLLINSAVHALVDKKIDDKTRSAVEVFIRLMGMNEQAKPTLMQAVGALPQAQQDLFKEKFKMN